MKNYIFYCGLLLLCSLAACQKETIDSESPEITQSTKEFTLGEAQQWFEIQMASDSVALGTTPLWHAARLQQQSGTTYLLVPIPGQPLFQGIPQGYRQLRIHRDQRSQKLTAAIYEVIPDAIYHQTNRQSTSADFSGRIFRYNLRYQFQNGLLYDKGKPVGSARPLSSIEKIAYQYQQLQPVLIGDQRYRPTTDRQIELRFYGGCHWVTSTYIDSEGVFTVYAESFCNYYFDGVNPNETDMKSVIFDGGGGGGNNNYQPPAPAEPTNLPMEEQPSKNPKKLMDCFGSTQSQTAAYQVKILVQEPQPGTSFNVGQNAFGHVALQLSKTEGGSTTTQTLGFYPSGTGLDKLNSASRIVDNGGLSYNVSATYYVDPQQFQHLITYVRNPPANYHYTGFNCTNFVYQAALQANINLPNPTTVIGLGAPGNTATAMTPAGMGSALRDFKANNPSANITTANGRAPASRGECD